MISEALLDICAWIHFGVFEVRILSHWLMLSQEGALQQMGSLRFSPQ
jgi:hypothetical protein